MPVILATLEAEIERVMGADQPEQGVHKTPSQQKKAGHDGVHLSFQWQQEV
jgi:hypothetical protein